MGDCEGGEGVVGNGEGGRGWKEMVKGEEGVTGNNKGGVENRGGGKGW